MEQVVFSLCYRVFFLFTWSVQSAAIISENIKPLFSSFLGSSLAFFASQRSQCCNIVCSGMFNLVFKNQREMIYVLVFANLHFNSVGWQDSAYNFLSPKTWRNSVPRQKSCIFFHFYILLCCSQFTYNFAIVFFLLKSHINSNILYTKLYQGLGCS